MNTPPYLQPGDKIGIIATARKITEEEVNPAIRILESWGLETATGKHLFSTDHQFAGNDDNRTADFQEMLDDDTVKAIICARGGYGTYRIIDRLDLTGFREQPKWIIGYSDVTVLHAHIHTHCSVETLHATMPINFPNNTEAALNSLRSALFGKGLAYQIDGSPLNRQGSCHGNLIGGNLSILYSLNCTPSDPDTKGKILFLEDLDEYLYHIDRMMMNLKRSGKLDHLAGLIIGGMTDMNDNDTPFGKSAEEIIAEAVAPYDYPVCFQFPAGHLPDNRAMIMGREITLEVGEKVTVNFR